MKALTIKSWDDIQTLGYEIVTQLQAQGDDIEASLAKLDLRGDCIAPGKEEDIRTALKNLLEWVDYYVACSEQWATVRQLSEMDASVKSLRAFLKKAGGNERSVQKLWLDLRRKKTATTKQMPSPEEIFRWQRRYNHERFEKIFGLGYLTWPHEPRRSSCWISGDTPERCHIIPKALGGTNHPSNLVLMHRSFNATNPHTSDPEIFWQWFEATYNDHKTTIAKCWMKAFPDKNPDLMLMAVLAKWKDKHNTTAADLLGTRISFPGFVSDAQMWESGETQVALLNKKLLEQIWPDYENYDHKKDRVALIRKLETLRKKVEAAKAYLLYVERITGTFDWLSSKTQTLEFIKAQKVTEKYRNKPEVGGLTEAGLTALGNMEGIRAAHEKDLEHTAKEELEKT